MADRTVSVQLKADPKAFIAGMAAAEAAAKKFRDSLRDTFGDPFKDMPSELPLPKLPRDAPSKLPKEGEEAAGAFARGFKTRLETAFKALPKVKLGADATEAQTRVQDLRARLAELSGKTIGVDIDAATALAEMAAIKAELQTIDTSADVDLRADASVAIAQIAALQHAVDLLNTNAAERELANLQARLAELGSREIGVDLDAGAAKTELAELQRGLERLNRTSADPRIRVDTVTAIAQIAALQAEIDGLNTERPEQKLAGLRSRLAELQARRIGVDIDAGAAKAELASIQGELRRLNASTPNVQVRVDSMAAIAQVAALQAEIDGLNTASPQRELADLQARLDMLRSRTIGVDLDAGAAKAELAEVQRALERLNRTSADPRIRVDSARALADVRTLESELSGVERRSPNISVTADVGGALMSIGMVAAALASLPAVTSVAVGVGALGAAFAAAGVGAAGFAAVAIPSLGRVSEALAEQETSAGAAGGAVETLAQKQAKAASSAMSLAQATDRVKDSQAAVRQAQEQVGIVAEQVAERQASATRRVEDAERSVADAHRATQRALEDLSRAREDARERLEDLALATERGVLSEERARISIARARADLAKTQADPKASALDREDARLRVREAEQALKEVRERNGDLAKEQAKASREGVEGSDEVRRAKDAITAASQREQDAERNLGDARDAAARTAVEGQRAIAKAHADVLKAQRDALRAAQQLKVVQLQQKAALDQAGGSAGGAAKKMSELSKAERQLAKDIKGFKDEYEDWQKSLQGDVFPAISGGLDLIRSQLPRLSPLVRTAGRSFAGLAKDAKAGLRAPFWSEFLFDVNTHMPRAIEGLGHTAGNVFTGIAGVIDALLPHTDGVVSSIEAASKKFADWGTGLKSNPAFQEFIDYAKENGPKVAELIGNIATAVGNILSAGADAGSGALDILVDISEKLRDLSPEQIQAVAVGVGAVMAAFKLGTTLKLGGWLLAAELISKMSPGQIQAVATAIGAVVLAMKAKGVADWWSGLGGSIDKAGNAAQGAKGKFAGLKDVLTGGGGMALAITGVAAGVGALDRELSGLNPNMDNLARHLGDMAKGGKPAADVLDQIGGSASLIDARGLEDIGSVVERMVSNDWWKKLDTQMGSAANTIGGLVGISFDHGADRVQNLDRALATMVTSGRADDAAGLFEAFTKKAQDAGVPLEKLRDLFPQYTSAVGGSVKPTKDAASAIDDAKSKLDGFNSSMNAFTGRTDFAQAVETLKGKYDDLVKALKDSNGNLDISKAKTDAQREAVIQARDKFSGLIQGVRDLADRQKDLGGSTDDVKGAVLDQVGALLKLAGRSKEAKDLVYDLARNFGITKTEADKAKGGVKDVKEALDKLKNKTVHVDADTSKAENAIKTLINKYNGYKIITQVDPKTGRTSTSYVKEADGGVVRYAQGGIARFAAGVEKHVAQIARPGTIRIWNEEETGGEAYIPLASSKRARSLQILEAVAGEFGRMVVPLPGGTRASSGAVSAAPVTGGGPGGTVSVDLNNLDGLTLATGYTARVVTGAVADASKATAEAADQLGSTLDGGLSDLGSRISDLASSIDRLASSVDGLAASAGSAGSSSTTGSGGKTSSTSKTGSSAPSLATAAAKEAAKQAVLQKTGLASAVKKAKAGSGSSSDPWANAVTVTPVAMADGGLVTSPLILAGEAGAEMVVPLSASRRARGRETLHQAADMLGYKMFGGSLLGPRYSAGGGGGQVVVQVDERFIRRLEAAVREARGVNMQVTTYNPVAEATSTTTNRSLQYAANLGL